MQEGFAVPVVSIVGRGDSGRTTVLEGLIAELTQRGWRVGTAKNHAHETDIDVPGKDTWRHERAGAVLTMVSAPNRYGVIRRVDRARTLAELSAEAAGAIDILLTEGFRGSSPALIEVVRQARSAEPLCAPEELVALVTDVDALLVWPVPVFALDAASSLADFVEREFLTRA
jgi:molybdopterin-guanine dinucleotide biosynthesis protein MobB